MSSTSAAWVCRCGKNGELEEYFIKNGKVGIKIDSLYSFKNCTSYKELNLFLKDQLSKDTWSPKVVSRVHTFTQRMIEGDYVLVPSKIIFKAYHLGVLYGDCIFAPYDELTFSRNVEWLGLLKKEELDEETNN